MDQAAVSQLQAELAKLTTAVVTMQSRLDDRGQQGNEEMEEDEEAAPPEGRSIGDEQEEWDWVTAGIIPPVREEPSKPHAISLNKLVENPPPLESLKKTTTKQFTGPPRTAPPRKHRLDTKLAILQAKQEHALHALVNSQEKEDRQSIAQAAAFIRSSWEDTQQLRKNIMAGKQSYKLDKRQDDDRPRLLTKEEEQRITKTRKNFVPRARTMWGDTPATSSNQGQPNHTPAPHRPRGKGKGKGKGL